MLSTRFLYRTFLVVILSILLTPLVAEKGAQALETQITEDLSLDLSTTLRWGGAWRLKDQDKALLIDPNIDDGNRNFDKGDMINNLFSVVVDAELKYKNYGVFVRPRAYYDFAYDNHNANDSPKTNNHVPSYGGPLKATNEFLEKTQDLHRDKIEILDAFAYGTFDISGHDLTLRVGNQVVSWGESLFLLNSISSAQSPVDATKLNAPGVELRDVFLPTGQIYAQADLWHNFTFEGFYQWEWDRNRIDEAGAYFSTDDYLYKAGRNILVPVDLDSGLAATVNHASDDEADDSGQWGAALRYTAEKLNDTEFGFYFMNYHEKMPLLIGSFSGGSPQMDWTDIVPGPDGELLNLVDGSSYHLSYAEDVKLYGVSFSGIIGDTNVAGEVSYRDNFPVMVADANNIVELSYKDAQVLQAQVSFIHIFSPLFAPFWDQTTVLGEVGLNQVYGTGGADLVNDRFAWGGAVEVDLDFYNFLLPRLDMKIPLVYEFYPSGKSSVLGTFSEDANKFGVGLNFTYLGVYEFGVGYTAFLGDTDDNLLSDRDFLSCYLSYTF